MTLYKLRIKPEAYAWRGIVEEADTTDIQQPIAAWVGNHVFFSAPDKDTAQRAADIVVAQYGNKGLYYIAEALQTFVSYWYS